MFGASQGARGGDESGSLSSVGAGVGTCKFACGAPAESLPRVPPTERDRLQHDID